MNHIRHGLLAAALCLVVTSCDRGPRHAAADPRWIQLEGTRLEYAHKVELAQFKLDRHEATLPGGNESPIADLGTLRARAAELLAQRDLLQTNLTNAEIAAISDHRTQVEIARAKAVGKEYPVFQALGGRSYENAKVAAVTDAGVKLVHASGVARLSYSDLNESQRVLFGLDASFEQAAQDRQRAEEIAYHRWMDREIAANAPKVEAGPARKASGSTALAKAVSIAARVAPPTVQANVPTLQRKERISSSGNSRTRSRRTTYYYPATYYYRPSYSVGPIYPNSRSVSISGQPSYCRPVTPAPVFRPNQ